MNLEGHGPEWEESEKPAIEQLIQMGYEYKSQRELNSTRESYNDPLLVDRFEKSILKLNPWIDEEGIADILRQLKKIDTRIAIDANEITHAKIIGLSRQHLEPITVVQDLGNGSKPHTVKIIDFDNIANNDFIVTNQLTIWGHKENILPDIVVYVNGMPLVVIECKSPFISSPIHAAITDNISRYQARNTGFEKLFYYNQIVIATCGTQAQYANPFADENLYREWKEAYPLNDEQVKEKFGRSRKQEILISGLLSKENLLDLIRNFTVYETVDSKRIKKLAKYQQFRTVRKSLEKIEQGKKSDEKGGVIWHTQGSGKSLSMVWLALQIKRKYKNPTILVVTDRRQLDRQIHDTFVSCGFPNPEKAEDIDDLKSLITNHKGKTIMTTIFKFPFFKDVDPYAVSEEQLFVLVDEGHRSQHGVTHADMRTALPNAVFFAFTGTPLIKNSKTRQVFGDYVDTYKISESEADGATIPIYYDGRLNELHVEGETVNKAFDRITKDYDKETKMLAMKKHANKTAIANSPARIKKICLDILDHYENTIKPNGLKAMIVAPSRAAAVTYKEELDKLNGPESRIIMTSMPKDKEFGWDKYQLTQSDKERYAERFKLAIEEEGLSILIVVDMLLTGFDAPILQVMYLDQGIKEHNLLQAIARVNRPYGVMKKHGLIVDYWGISENLVDAFEMYDSDDIKDIIKPLDDAKHQLMLRHAKVMIHFKDMDRNDLDALIELLTPVDKREEFEYDFKQFSEYMEIVLPDPEAAKYRKDLSFLSKTRAAVRTAFQDENLDLRDLGSKIKKLIEESIQSKESIQLIPPTKIDSKNFVKLIGSYKSNKVKASVIEAQSRKIIREKREQNPDYYDTLSKKLQDIIDKLKNKKYEDAELFNSLQEFLHELYEGEEEQTKEEGFDNKKQYAIFRELLKHFNKEKAKELTKKIYSTIDSLIVVDWKGSDDDQKKMRVSLREILTDNKMDYEDAKILAIYIIGLMKGTDK